MNMRPSEIYAHRSISGRESGAKPQSIEAVRDALATGKNIEVDVSANGRIGHVKDNGNWNDNYDESQAAWENQPSETIENPRFDDILWLAVRSGGKVLAEIKASSPQKAVEAAGVAFDDAERVYGALSSHDLDAADVINKDSAVSFMSFSVEALDTIAERQQATLHDGLREAPKVLLGTSKPENVHDMSISATVLEVMDAAGIAYKDMPWGHALVDLAAQKGYDTIAPHWSVIDDEFMAHATERGVAVGAWTVPGDKMDELEAKGVTTIITEQAVPYEREQMREKALAKRALR